MTSSHAFQPTLLQKLLGRNYKWWYVFYYHLRRNTHYRIDIVAFRIGDLVLILAVILAWQLPESNRTAFEWQQLVTYFIIGNIIESFTKCYYDSLIAKKIQNGTFASQLLNPQSVFKEILVSGAGTFVFPNISSVLMVCILFIPYASQIITFQGNIFNFIALVLTLLFAWLNRALFMIISAFLAFWTTETSGINFASKNVTTILAGSVIPFSYFPQAWRFLEYSPFAFYFYHPMQIYLGKYDNVQTGWTLLGGIAWCIVLYFFAKWVFKMGLKRNESVGL